MSFLLFKFFLLNISLIYANTSGGHSTTNSKSPSPPTNELGLTFGHTVNQRENIVTIYFDVSNSTFKEYRYYYYDFRPFGSRDHIEYLPRQRLIDTHNSLRVVGLHENDYVSCLSFIDEYETISKPRYACYEFTLGEKTIGSHHGGSSGYLAPLLLAVAFIIHVFIAVVHHIKAKHYARRLLHRFIDVSPRSNTRRINVSHSLRELDKELDHPHLPANVQRRLSRVTIDAHPIDDLNHGGTFLNDELPLYTIPHHSRRVSLTIPENRNSNTMDSISSMKHLIDSVPWTKRLNHSMSRRS